MPRLDEGRRHRFRFFAAMLGVAVPILAFGSLGSAQSPPAAVRTSIGTGPNGPIPAIVVDQFGYPSLATKVAVIRSPQVGYDRTAQYSPGATIAVVDQASQKIVLQGPPAVWSNGATDQVSGDKAWWFDFSAVTVPGTYAIVDLERNVRSYTFRIGDQIYRDVLKHAVRTYFYQRAGFEKTAAHVGQAWADRASHLGKGQDSESHSWLAKTDAAQVRDLRGGWYDAGDYNKYTSWTARNVIMLLHAYEANPAAFGDDLGIAESGNGVPDLLDELKWGLEWLERMQNEDGSLLCIQGLASGSPPSAVTGPSYYGPPTTAATLTAAGAFAYAAKIYAARSEAPLQAFGRALGERAKRAWAWANAHPNVTYYNNDEGKQPGSGGLGAGQQEVTDPQRVIARLHAAVYLYGLTSDAVYKSAAESVFDAVVPFYGPTQWDGEPQDTLLYFIDLPGLSADFRAAAIKKFVEAMTRHPDQLPLVFEGKDPYRAPMKDYTWGSNQSKGAEARLYWLLSKYAGDPNIAALARSASLEFVHYIHGTNPLGLVYLSNMKAAGASNSASIIYHAWFSSGSRKWKQVSNDTPGPAPGFLAGGPNPLYVVDTCCKAPMGAANYRCGFSKNYSLCSMSLSPPLGQPPAKAYLQFNDDWPVGAWQITEPSNFYQAQYILALAPFVR